MHERFAVPEPVMLVGDIVHEVLFVDRLTIPVKLLIAVMVIVEVPVPLTLTLTVEGLAEIEKS